MNPTLPTQTDRWLLLIHQLPPKPNYLRVKIGRRLAALGAVALKNTVYVLPRTASAQEDLQWVLREIVAAGGEASLLTAQLVDGVSDADIERMFRSARDSDYTMLAQQARDLERRCARLKMTDERRRDTELDVRRIERQLESITSIDFFGAAGRESVHGLLVALRARLAPPPAAAVSAPIKETYLGRTWVTRVDIHVDRIASAWLIQRFIDPEAQIKFVSPKGYVPEAGELRFDMFEAEFSHEGDLCTFEVLCKRWRLNVPGLRALAEIVHDIDLKDAKFGRAETAGIDAQIDGLARLQPDDKARLARGCELFDELLAHFAKKKIAKEAP